MRQTKNRSPGFSLVEVMFSVAAMAIAALGVLSVLTFGTLAGDFAGTFSEATQMGREVTENIRVDRFALDPFNPPSGLVDANPDTRTPLNAPPFDTLTSSLPADSRFTRNIQITEIDPGRMVLIRARIFWTQNSKEKHVDTYAYARSGV